MIDRSSFLNRIRENLEVHPVCGLLGPRQCGKTTLAKRYTASATNIDVHFFDLENPFDLGSLDQAMTLLSGLTGLVVIDEIQRKPDLFPILRVLSDTTDLKFLVLGSASRDLIKQSSESLAGRIGYVELRPFSITETGEIAKLWVRGGFPKSFLASSDASSLTWRTAYIRTFLEQDIPNLGFQIHPAQLNRFWMMLAHYHGQLLNASEIGRSLSINYHTVRNYIDVLSGTFMMRSLQPWFSNISKRQVKSPKIYFRDTGILHAMLQLGDQTALERHPKLGASWEGFALEEVIRYYNIPGDHVYFWRTQSGVEIDLFFQYKGKNIGFEFKFADQVKLTRSMHIALEDIELDHLYLVCPGNKVAKIDQKITVLGLDQLSRLPL